tara:strand:- start:171 stop:470 length:300 start_codon:yes stop_codon:yes gene_type:complete
MNPHARPWTPRTPARRIFTKEEYDRYDDAYIKATIDAYLNTILPAIAEDFRRRLEQETESEEVIRRLTGRFGKRLAQLKKKWTLKEVDAIYNKVVKLNK